MQWLDALTRLRGATVSPFVRASFERAVQDIEDRTRRSSARGRLTLADAQFLIARAHSFEGWRDFARHVEGLSRDDGKPDPFESAADAVVRGDLRTLESLLRGYPDLIRARSAREHHATLLHYVAANGVEDFRQLTPPNAVAVARSLLERRVRVQSLPRTLRRSRGCPPLDLM